ncbi:MAG: bifunctional [glutamate--ammonia ligase]-adenylyl-L-tyrosine phosphorylase/[glutamate--ammonia-ligase] adenylyltransferase, partial [Planctomycetia bacterium]|nr:bifunctional [glutamate--ammonia ligase]-adenylyl-L-tyrosine phosphorylase/[glutamate--ammonia-ligase] adenylyltransferase [Planctomycetia bacterium]
MDSETLREYLDDPAAAGPWLRTLGVLDPARAHTNLVAMAVSGVTLDLLAVIGDQLAERLPGCADPDMAINNLERFVAAARNRLGVGTLFQRDPASLRTLIQIFSTSQYLSDVLITDRESLDLLRLTEGQPMARRPMVDELVAEVGALERDQAVLGALRRFKYRETLRIAYGDISREHGLRIVTRQISYVADAVLEAALRAAGRKIGQQHGTPWRRDGQPAHMVILAMGKLGGVELNYSSDIDLIFLYDDDGQTDGRRRITNAEFFSHLARECVRLLTLQTDLGAAYRVDLRLRPDGERGPMVASVPAALRYYDLRGRTWERQAYIKARPAAGDLALGHDFLDRMRPWIYRRYLSRADISGIKTIKRRIERRSDRQGVDAHDVKTGHGGIRDVEFVIQFLQLLNGANLPELQTGNTLEAIVQLESAGCLSNLERTLLEENYSFLRKIEHRLQIMFDLQTHLLPKTPGEVRKLALRMGYAERPGRTALAAFEADYRDKTALNRRILDHLLHDAFPDDEKTEAEVDLVLDP